jgi:hypothetical protein
MILIAYHAVKEQAFFHLNRHLTNQLPDFRRVRGDYCIKISVRQILKIQGFKEPFRFTIQFSII